MSRVRGTPVLWLVLALVASGCGGDSSSRAREAPAQPDVSGWSEQAWRDPGTAGMTTHTQARAAEEDGFDRLTLVFEDRVPGYGVRYADGPLHQCGSGRPIEPLGSAHLVITLEPARAHDEQGRPTVQQRSLSPGLPVLRAGRLVCDFEGRVEWVVGLERRVALRVQSLGSPARLAVDLRH